MSGLVLGRAILLLVLVASGYLGWRMLRRQGPVAHWIVAWAAAGMSGSLALAAGALPVVHYLGHPLGTLFAALLLAGALVYAGRPVPRWLLPAALAWGAVRAGVAAAGHEPLAWGLALVCEPAASLGAAWVVWRARAPADAGAGERWLGPAMAMLALVGTAHVAWLASGRGPELLVPLWLAVGPPVLGLQIQATANRLRRRMRRTFEAAVAERTAALAASEDRYRTVSELSADLSFRARIDRERRLAFVWHSGPIAAVTGYPPEDLAGHGWLRLFDESRRHELGARIDQLPLGRTFAREREIVGPQGERRWISIRLIGTGRDADGTLDLVGSISDVTGRRRAEEERRRLESHIERVERLESLGVLAGGIAHDFNNLLTVVRGNARLALAELPADAPLRARLERIDDAAAHAAALTGQMLTYAGKARSSLGPLDLSQVIASIRTLLEASVAAACEVDVDCAPGMPAVEGDDAQLRQVLLNLVLNASDALGGRPGRVAIRAYAADLGAAELAGALGSELAPGRFVVLEVEDSGAGMDAATLARVCEPFFTTKFSGRGLGMPAVLGIVRSHRGALAFRSAPGQGTTVRVLLPASERQVAERPAAPAAEPVPAAKPAHAAGRCILVVDDDPSVRELAAELLARAGFAVSCAAGGVEAIDRVGSEAPIDAVLLDLTMPDLGGETTFLRLRALRPDLPVVLVSGYDAEQASQRFAARGLDGFVSKPFDPSELVEAVQAALRSRAS